MIATAVCVVGWGASRVLNQNSNLKTFWTKKVKVVMRDLSPGQFGRQSSYKFWKFNSQRTCCEDEFQHNEKGLHKTGTHHTATRDGIALDLVFKRGSRSICGLGGKLLRSLKP